MRTELTFGRTPEFAVGWHIPRGLLFGFSLDPNSPVGPYYALHLGPIYVSMWWREGDAR